MNSGCNFLFTLGAGKGIIQFQRQRQENNLNIDNWSPLEKTLMG